MCPWDGWPPANLVVCEAPVCGWIVHPADSWSNLGFFVVAWLIWRARRPGAAQWLAAICALTGVASFAFHATGTFAGQAADQSVMFLESAFFVTSAVARWRRRPWSRALYFALVIGSTTALLVWQTAGIALFAAQVTAFAFVETRLLLRERATTRYRPLVIAVALFAVAYGAWWLDKLDVWCQPHNHVFSGHALWHLLGAASFWFWHRFFAQHDR